MHVLCGVVALIPHVAWSPMLGLRAVYSEFIKSTALIMGF